MSNALLDYAYQLAEREQQREEFLRVASLCTHQEVFQILSIMARFALTKLEPGSAEAIKLRKALDDAQQAMVEGD